MDDQGREEYLAAIHREYLHISNKDGLLTDREQKRLKQISEINGAEPDLQKLLINLEKRQSQEMRTLRDRVIRDKSIDTTAALKQQEDLDKRHDQERERYVRDYQQAKEKLREVNENSKQLSKDRGLTL